MPVSVLSGAKVKTLPPPLPSAAPVRRFLRWLVLATDAVFGFVTLVLGLAIVSAVPVLGLFSLGYLLDASSRVAKSGRLRDGFPGLLAISLVGKIALGTWLWTLPVRLVHSFWRDAELIEAGGARADQLRIFLAVLAVAVTLHVAWACLRGGKLRHFLWPAPVRFVQWLGEPREWRGVRDNFREYFRGFRPVETWLLGLRGFAGAAAWLAVPVGILVLSAEAGNNGVAFLGALLGGILLGIAVLFVPFLQTRFAMSGRFRDFFSLGEIRALFRRAPLAFWFALFVTLLFALPLYLLKIELTPREVAWLPNLVFVLFILPARLLVGWAIARAERCDTNRIWVSRWIARLAAVPVVAVYVFLVWLTQYLSWHGSLSLLEQHAFLVPAPLLGL